MNRSTKALARLGTLAVLAGVALGTPLAIGTASAASGIGTVTITNGNITSVNEDVNQDNYSAGTMGTVELTGATVGDTINYTLESGTAYFKHPGSADVTINSPTTLTCVVDASTDCGPTRVGDDVAESAKLVIEDVTSGDTGIVETAVGFNGIDIQGCTATGFETATGLGAPESPASVNCETQAQLGVPLTESLTYLAGGVGVSGIDITIVITSGSGDALFTGGQPTGTTSVFPFDIAHCTTQAGGVCNFTINDTNATAEPAELATGIVFGGALTYPAITADPPGPTQLVNFVTHSVTPTRLDLVSSTLIAPTSQAGLAVDAEPGDVVQNTYEVRGACSIVAPVTSCDTGQPLAGVSMAVAVDQGFFTPNCVSPQSTGATPFAGVNNYDNCSFSTAPTVGSQTDAATGAGALTNSGQTETVSTDIGGFFTVSIAMGRNALFDQNGLVVSKVTANTLPSQQTGAEIPANCTGNHLEQPTATGASGDTDPAAAGCPEDVEWTTREQPLNGGTAKYLVIPSLSQPNNTAIQTENNFTVDDTKTWNVPDVDRVDFLFHVTDQFGNLTQEADGSSVGQPTLTKTGPGAVYICGAFSATSACSGPAPLFAPAVAQADGSFKQSGPVFGSYLNNTPLVGGQIRYQADSTDASVGIPNLGWPCVAGSPGTCSGALTTGNPGVGDGTQTDALTWSPPTSTFASYIPGSPVFATYTAGTGAAGSDTLTLNFYNQLAQPVVTFAVSPGNKVMPGTGVTVTATVVDQNGNPIINQPIDALRSGSNEPSCQPTQTVGNGGAVTTPLFTNTSGIAGYTFSCSAAGVSTVSMVVEGPGGTQLAAGHEEITFSGSATHTTVERPRVSLTSFHAHHLTVHVSTSPALGATRTVDVYRLVNGLKHLVGQTHTGPAGRAALTIGGLRSGATWRISVKVINLGTQYRSEYSTAVNHTIK